MEITRPYLLIVGDSYFYKDPKFPGQHWSEMLPDYRVINCAYPGNSNGMILHDLLNGLKHSPDAVVIGFTGPGRIEFENTHVTVNRQWITNQHQHLLNLDQKLLITLRQSLTNPVWENFNAFWQIVGTLSVLKNRNIPFVYSLGIYQQLMAVTELLIQHSDVVKDQLSRFASHAIGLNLATYPLELQKAFDPLFHVQDPDWQSRFANEVITKLKILDI
jgi:hypothetical protein